MSDTRVGPGPVGLGPVGPFVLERPLATRAMGEVWAAVHEPSGAPVALKFLARKHATVTRGGRVSRRGEGDRDRRASGVARIHHYGTPKGGAVRDGRAPGGLAAGARRRPSDPPVAPRRSRTRSGGLIATTPGRGLAHARGRDAVGARWVLAKIGSITAIWSASHRRRGRAVPQYMAPEQFAGQRRRAVDGSLRSVASRRGS
jgi:hypothetical protein